MKHRKAEQKAPGRKLWLRISLIVLLCAVLVFSASSPGGRIWDTLFKTVNLSHFTAKLPEDRLHIHVIDVGKADAILIESPGANLLVDTGTAERADTVLRYLRARSVSGLDAVILTHGDSDHAGGLQEILREVPAEKLLVSPWLPDPQTETPMQTAAAGEQIAVGDLLLEVLGPAEEYDSENDNSLVFRLRYGEFSMLFCGDIEADAERALLESEADLQADVLKVAHHGSNTSTSADFLAAVQPSYAVISTGPDRNHLPRNAVLKRLEDAGIAFFRTDRHGSVVLSADGGKEIIITTENAG